MNIGLIDVDGHNYPNLPLMKLSAWHKQNGDHAEMYSPMFSGHVDKVYMSKVFSFTQDYQYFINADEIIKGGTGYYYPSGGNPLLEEIENIYPDYGLYGIKNTAYGFLTRGCPRNCDFCIVGKKEGLKSHKVANLEDFWRGQKNIELMDPNLLASKECNELLLQLSKSKARVDVNQGFDARLLTEEKIELIKNIKLSNIHFAWDDINDEKYIVPKLQLFKKITGLSHRLITVYVLTNFNSTVEEDLYRIYKLRDIGCNPYVMIYNKDKTKSTDTIRKIQRWVNNRFIWEKVKTFEEYLGGMQ